MAIKRFCLLALVMALFLNPATAFAQNGAGGAEPETEMTAEEFAQKFQSTLMDVSKAAAEEEAKKQTEKPRAVVLGVSLAVVLAAGGYAAFKVLSNDAPQKGKIQKPKAKTQ